MRELEVGQARWWAAFRAAKCVSRAQHRFSCAVHLTLEVTRTKYGFVKLFLLASTPARKPDLAVLVRIAVSVGSLQDLLVVKLHTYAHWFPQDLYTWKHGLVPSLLSSESSGQPLTLDV
jgi:hypothetical protein